MASTKPQALQGAPHQMNYNRNNPEDLKIGIYKRINHTHAMEEIHRCQHDLEGTAFQILTRLALRSALFDLLYPDSVKQEKIN